MSRSTSDRPRVDVMHADNAANPFVASLMVHLSRSFDARPFRLRSALLGRLPDALLIQWPESLIRGRSPWRSLAKSAVTLIYFLRLKLHGRAIVEIAHNVEAHEAPTRYESIALRLVHQATTGQILLNPTRLLSTAPSRVIPHPEYRDHIPHHILSSCMNARPIEDGIVDILTFGQIRRYKLLPEAARVLIQFPDSIRYTIWGAPIDSGVVRELVDLTASASNLTLRLEFIQSETLYERIAESQIVLLPYKNFYNSGAALLALSLNRPIIAPRNPATAALRQECGSEWVHLFEFMDEIPSVVQKFRDRPIPLSSSPNLRARNWSILGPQYVEFIDSLVQ